MTVKTFIDRPILSGVISVLIVILGVIGLTQLPIEQFPNIAPPTVRVQASYTGANAETVMKSVIVPLEESLNGVEDMMYMTSTATNTGTSSITIYFKQGTDADMAVVNVQNRVASAQGLLPAEVTKSGVTVRKRQNSTLKSITLYSPDDTYDSKFLTNYMKINIEPQISRISGVGEVNIFSAEYAMRIWLDPAKMSQYGLIPADIETVLAQQNIESPTGTLGAESENTFQYVLKYRGRYEDETEYENLVVRALPDGSILRLKDIAEVELGAVNYAMISETSGHPGANAMIAQTAGSNANEVIKEIDKTLDLLRERLPAGMILTDISSTKDFLDASIAKVIETLVIALILVVLVVYLFLHDFRATIIPAISIIVSLTGTFAFIYAIGFTLNMLTLFAIVLVIGTVVDDSVVVVEAVQAKFEDGETSPYTATVSAMGGLSAALITTTIVFMAVFIPVCFMGGTAGTFYRQFGLTMAVAVGISLLNAMTLCPALSAILMRPANHAAAQSSVLKRFHYAFDRSFSAVTGQYKNGVMFLFKNRWIVAALLLLSVIGLTWLISTTKTGLIPQEDMGTLSLNIQVAPGSNLAQTEAAMDQVEEAIKTIPEIYIYSREDNEISHLNNYQLCIADDLKRSYTPVTSSGNQLLDGLQATGYCRIRYIAGGDFMRAQHQREVLQAVAEQAKKASPTALGDIATNVFSEVYTSLDLTEIISLLADVSNYSITETAGFPREENRTTGRLGEKGDCVIPVNLEENVKWLHQFLFNDYEYTPSAMVQECSKKIEADTGKTLN